MILSKEIILLYWYTSCKYITFSPKVWKNKPEMLPTPHFSDPEVCTVVYYCFGDRLSDLDLCFLFFRLCMNAYFHGILRPLRASGFWEDAQLSAGLSDDYVRKYWQGLHPWTDIWCFLLWCRCQYICYSSFMFHWPLSLPKQLRNSYRFPDLKETR